MQKLNLAIYTPSAFILASALHKYVDVDDEMGHRLTLEGREMGIRRLMSINMLKRLESSVNSFLLTLNRIESVIADTIARIDCREEKLNVEDALVHDWDIDDQDNDMFIGTRKNQILLADMDYVSWRKYLSQDMETLQ